MASTVSVYWDGEDRDVEDPQRYAAGGFHPISLGDVMTAHSPLRQYRILHKLGRGAYSTVWLAETLHLESQRYVALKVCAADADSQHELEIFSHLPHNGSQNVVRLLDSFSLQGPNGSHTILVHDVLGQPTTLMRSPTRSAHRVLCQQLAQGVATLHRHGIVHGDLHLGNIGVALPTLNDHSIRDIFDDVGSPECTIILPRERPSLPQALPPYLVPPISITEYLTRKDPTLHETRLRAEILDLGNAILVGKRSRPFCTLTAVCAPELIFEVVTQSIKLPPTPASDIWSFACTIYELVLGPQILGGRLVQANDQFLGSMARLCGEIPPSWKSYWESRETLRSMSISQEVADGNWQFRLEYYTTKKTYKHPEERPTKADISELFEFLRFMLKIDPRCRPSAEEVLAHPWFARVKVAQPKDVQKAPRDDSPPPLSSFP